MCEYSDFRDVCCLVLSMSVALRVIVLNTSRRVSVRDFRLVVRVFSLAYATSILLGSFSFVNPVFLLL